MGTARILAFLRSRPLEELRASEYVMGRSGHFFMGLFISIYILTIFGHIVSLIEIKMEPKRCRDTWYSDPDVFVRCPAEVKSR